MTAILQTILGRAVDQLGKASARCPLYSTTAPCRHGGCARSNRDSPRLIRTARRTCLHQLRSCKAALKTLGDVPDHSELLPCDDPLTQFISKVLGISSLRSSCRIKSDRMRTLLEKEAVSAAWMRLRPRLRAQKACCRVTSLASEEKNRKVIFHIHTHIYIYIHIYMYNYEICVYTSLYFYLYLYYIVFKHTIE